MNIHKFCRQSNVTCYNIIDKIPLLFANVPTDKFVVFFLRSDRLCQQIADVISIFSFHTIEGYRYSANVFRNNCDGIACFISTLIGCGNHNSPRPNLQFAIYDCALLPNHRNRIARKRAIFAIHCTCRALEYLIRRNSVFYIEIIHFLTLPVQDRFLYVTRFIITKGIHACFTL